MLANEKWDQSKVLDEVGTALLKISDYIDKHGWCQHAMRDLKGQVCISEAIAQIYMKKMMSEATLLNACQTLEEHITGERNGPWISGTVDWNDAGGRTKQEVIGLLHKLAYQKR
jgi:hypothetical protein